jgi:hypothetical protein
VSSKIDPRTATVRQTALSYIEVDERDMIRNELGISDIQIRLLLGVAFAVVYGIAEVPLGDLALRRRQSALSSRRPRRLCNKPLRSWPAPRTTGNHPTN